jgi:hypothetical protein
MFANFAFFACGSRIEAPEAGLPVGGAGHRSPNRTGILALLDGIVIHLLRIFPALA